MNLFLKFFKKKEDAYKFAFNAEIERRLGNFRSALKNINKAVRIDSSYSDYYMTRALIKRNLKDYKGALKDLDKAINMNPNYNWYYLYRYLVKKESKNYQNIEQELFLMEKNDNNNLDSLYDYLCDYSIKGNNKLEAISFLEKAMKVNPKNEKLLLKKINLLRERGMQSMVFEDINSLIALDDNNAEYYHIRANIFFDVKEYDKAIIDANKTIELNSNNDGYYFMRARIREKFNEYEGALEDINQAIKISDNNPFYFNFKDFILKEIGV